MCYILNQKFACAILNQKQKMALHEYGTVVVLGGQRVNSNMDHPKHYAGMHLQFACRTTQRHCHRTESPPTEMTLIGKPIQH